MATVQAYGCVASQRTREGEIQALMVKRAEGFWEFPKGKQDEGESMHEAALRELKEETGLEAVILTREDALDYSYTVDSADGAYEKQVRLFLARVPAGSVPEPDGTEVVKCAWLPLHELESRATHPETKAIAAKAAVLLGD